MNNYQIPIEKAKSAKKTHKSGTREASSSFALAASSPAEDVPGGADPNDPIAPDEAVTEPREPHRPATRKPPAQRGAYAGAEQVRLRPSPPVLASGKS